MLTLIYIALGAYLIGGIVAFAIRNKKYYIISKLRNTSIIPTWATDKVVDFMRSECFAILKKEENMSIASKMMLAITFFYVVGEPIGKISNLNIIMVLVVLQSSAIIWIINMKVSEKMRRFYFYMVFACVICMFVLMWLKSVILMDYFLLLGKPDVASLIIDLCIMFLVGGLNVLCQKWCGTSRKAKEYRRCFGCILFVLMLFSFGMFNFIYFDHSVDKAELIAIFDADSTLLYCGRMIYTGLLLVPYGIGYITRQIMYTDYANLSIIYELGVQYSYNEFVLLNELIMVLGYIAIVFRPKFFYKLIKKIIEVV